MWQKLQALKYLMHVLPMESLENVADTILDIAEEAIKKTDTKVDDQIIGSAITGVRVAFGIKDGDD